MAEKWSLSWYQWDFEKRKKIELTAVANVEKQNDWQWVEYLFMSWSADLSVSNYESIQIL